MIVKHAVACALFLSLPFSLHAKDGAPIPDKLAIGWLGADDALDKMKACVPTVTADDLQQARRKSRTMSLVFAPKNAPAKPYLVTMEDKYGCIRRNGAGKPLLPAKFFSEVLQLEGPSADKVKKLYASIASGIAAKGSAKILLKPDNGRPLEIIFSGPGDAPDSIRFAVTPLEAATYDKSKYAFVLDKDVKNHSLMSFGPREQNATPLLHGEFAPRPQKDNYLLVKGSPETASFRFAGTTWRAPNGIKVRLKDKGRIEVESDPGQVRVGAWRVENGALYFHHDTVYGSAALDGRTRLEVDLRNLNPAANGAPASEFRWITALEKVE